MKEFISGLTWVEYAALIAVLRGAWVGFRSGFFPELLRITAYLITVVVTFYFKDTAAEFITINTFLNQGAADIAAFSALFLGTLLVTKLVTMVFVKLLKVGEGNFLVRLIGMILGMCRWLILLSLIFMLIGYLPLESLKEDIHKRSVVGPHIATLASTLFDYFSHSTPPQIPVNN